MSHQIHEMMIRERLNDLQRETENIRMIRNARMEEEKGRGGFLLSLAEFLIWSGNKLKKRYASSNHDMTAYDNCKHKVCS